MHTYIPYKGRGVATEQTPIMFTVGEVKVDFSLVCSIYIEGFVPALD